MGVSLIDIIKEEIRETITGDDRFFARHPYAFVLNGPGFKGPIGPFGYAVFPLPIAPESFSYRMPFAGETTALQQGGVVAEEAGIVIGEIAIEATTGFKLRKNIDTSFGPGDGGFTGELGHEGAFFSEISGQLAFWRLANRCFDAYSALKKDPESAAKTTLEFHSLHDKLHLLVIPKEFSLTRTAARERVSYRFSVRLEVVGPSDKLSDFPSPDKGLLATIKDTISKIRSTIQAVAATIDDVTAAIDDIRRTISSVVAIISDFTTVIGAFEDLVSGVKSFLDIPRQTLVALTAQAEEFANLAASIAGWPADVAQAGRDLADAGNALIVAGTDHFREKWDSQIARYKELTKKEPLTDVKSSEFAVGQTPGTGPTTFSVSDVFGGGEKPGDARRTRNTRTNDRLSETYVGIEERVVGAGDTLQSLAAKYLGDARKWIDLAVVNGLRAPFISDARLPNALLVGDKISIPIKAPKETADVITAGSPTTGASQSEEFLGEDFELVQIDKDTWGWAVNESGGSVDARKVKGIPNFVQAIQARFRTEQGTNILYPSIGMPRAVGQRGVTDRVAAVRFMARAQLLADKRVERLARYGLKLTQDVLELEADLVPRGFTTSRTITQQLT